ncbi:MAG: nitronate monooxygenase [Marinobacter sp.]
MVGVSTPELAAAVSNAGGLGSIGIGTSTVEKAREMISATRALTDNPFNVNVFCHKAAVPDPQRELDWIKHLQSFFKQLDAAPPSQLTTPYQSFNEGRATLDMHLQEKSAVVSFHFGLPPVEWIKSQRGIRGQCQLSLCTEK